MVILWWYNISSFLLLTLGDAIHEGSATMIDVGICNLDCKKMLQESFICIWCTSTFVSTTQHWLLFLQRTQSKVQGWLVFCTVLRWCDNSNPFIIITIITIILIIMIIMPISLFLHTASTILFIFQGAKTWALYSIRDDHNWQSFQGLRSLPILMPVCLFPHPASTILANQPTRRALNTAWPLHIHHCIALNTVWPLVHCIFTIAMRCQHLNTAWPPHIHNVAIIIANITIVSSSPEQGSDHRIFIIHNCNELSTQLSTSPQVSSF